MSGDKRRLRLVPIPETAMPGGEGGAELAVPDDAELVETDEVVDAVLVDDDATLPAISTSTAVSVRVIGRLAHIPRHERTRQSAQAVLIGGVTVGQGFHSWAVRAWDGMTIGVYRRQIRAAEALGDRVALAEWLESAQQARMLRHQRLMVLPRLLLGLVKIGVGVLIGVPLLLLVVALLVSWTDAGNFLDVWHWAGGVLRWLFGALAVAWSVLVVCLPVVLIAAAWREGRRRGAPVPRWLATAQARDTSGAPITPSIVVTALRDLGVSHLRQSIKAMGDAGAAMLSPISIAGCGVEVDAALPSGSSTKEVQDRRRKLAENLGRHEHEVHISLPKKARTVRLWIADSGALDEPIGPSPLVTRPKVDADYKKGRAPWGQNLRGEAVGLSLFQRHLLITGLSNQGKTASLRALALWLAFVLNVRFLIGDLKGVGDWAMFEGLAEVLIQGPTDEHVAQVTEMVEWGVNEMERRLQAPPGSKFDPLIIIVDEAQNAYMCPAKDYDGIPYGGTKANSRFFIGARKIHNQGRAVDVLLWQGTQNPTDQNLPVLVREGAHIRACLAVGTESQSRMALGENPVNGGAAPHLLRQGLDKGTVVMNGEGAELAAGQTSLTIRTHFISDPEADQIADRAKALRKGVTTRDGLPGEEEADPLEDIAAVLGDELRTGTQEVLLRLAELNSSRYRKWTFADLTRALEAAGAAPYKTDGRMHVSRDRVVNALARRDDDPSEGCDE
jgi:S-DNA-T family DNA segregation ATPase FtsK/SpoIIIE